MQSESCIWDRKRERESATVFCLERTRLRRQKEERKRRLFFFLLYFYHIMTCLCGGQHCVFIQAEDSVGHDGLVGQETAAHHLQRRKHKSAKSFKKKTPTSLSKQKSRFSPLLVCDLSAAWNKLKKERVKPLFLWFQGGNLQHCVAFYFLSKCIFLHLNSAEVFVPTDDSFY